MQNTVTVMSGANAQIPVKKAEAEKKTRTRSICYTSFTTTEDLANYGRLYVPVVQLRNPDYAVLLSAVDKDKDTITGKIRVVEIDVGAISNQASVHLENKTGAQIDAGATFHLMIVSQ